MEVLESKHLIQFLLLGGNGLWKVAAEGAGGRDGQTGSTWASGSKGAGGRGSCVLGSNLFQSVKISFYLSLNISTDIQKYAKAGRYKTISSFIQILLFFSVYIGRIISMKSSIKFADLKFSGLLAILPFSLLC